MLSPSTTFLLVGLWVSSTQCQPAPRTVYETIGFYGAAKFLDYTAKVSGLDTRLKDNSETLTVFAPTDRALDELPADVQNALDTDQTLLNSVISYHVAPGLPEFRDNGLVTTLAGASARVNFYSSPNVRSRTATGCLTMDSLLPDCSRRLLADNSAEPKQGLLTPSSSSCSDSSRSSASRAKLKGQ